MVASSRLVGFCLVLCLAVACGGHRSLPLRPASSQIEQVRPVASAAPAAQPPIDPPFDAELLALCDDIQTLRAIGYNARQVFGILVRTARSDREVRCVQAYAAEFFPALSAKWALPGDAGELAEWWSRFGSSAIYERLDSAHHVVFPGRASRTVSASELTRLSPLLCRDADASCGGSEAQALFAFAEREMARLGEARLLEEALQDASLENVPLPTNAALEADCERRARLAPEQERYGEWAACVERLVPMATRVPKARFKMPSRGTLVTERGSFWDACSETHAYSLETGLVLQRMRCAADDRKKTVRWKVGSVHSSAVRSAVLFAAVLELMLEEPAFARSFRIPEGFVDAPDRVVGRSVGRLSVSDARELHYEVRGVLASRFHETLLVDHEVEPKQRLLLDLLDGLAQAARFSCQAVKDRADVARLLEATSTSRGRLDDVLAEVSCSP